MDRFARPWPLPMLLVAMLLAAMSAIAAPARAQSSNACSAKAGARHPGGACSTAQPHGGTLRKCVSSGGGISIQDTPCPTGSRTAWARPTAPEQLSQARHRSLAQQARKRDADSRYLSRLAGTDRRSMRYANSRRSNARSSRTSSKHAACEAARQHRKTVLERVGLARTFELLRTLNDRVYEACQ